ncbi:glycerol-3-phosphate dehydrogenase/oxidase [Conexibacter sp. JD483]|uniref:glycerol-3-phosphate dehydrogenase/oxidase n=1 Tax=unclassified Conexibacter TaxID=2627773 RepID=UPI002715D0E0|nr:MULTISPECIES: glycerol-3-phosphate dehydrogenase/oxidase [unclassified Conexibacter]MDO8184109.1 glycerol-3-phosphate dehydrogenase/oxidase [Conexibacter sp. CPCC 205706]MDO8197101.1 glycerol-3-phosphate dehydrogenase/oxidase [Conexibacter sp. CPCC 205762]MDR9367584.1 glycerol-3-phosphate dehydrogenase/oxidase [Conexibacter sp. JD483]
MVSLRRTKAPTAAGSDSLNGARRAAELTRLSDGETVDVLVVGGGITGAWIALDAATRGLSVALIERGDLANGTSRWSSKLAHGGLRYLAHLDFGLAWESASERAVLMDVSAPHLIRAMPFLIPLGEHVNAAAGAKLETGIRIGDRMRAAAGTSRRRLPSVRRIAAEEARTLVPAISDRNLRGALLHWDAQLEDDARLVLAVARTAAAHGARILTYVRAQQLRPDGATVSDEHDGGGDAFDIRARHVVNATGVWAGELAPHVCLQPSKGAHLLVRAELLGEPRAGISAPIPGSGGSRFAFAVPRADGLVLIGITDEPYDGDSIPDAPPVSEADETFLLQSVSRVLERTLTPADVVGRYAGLRPLLAGTDDEATADLSRRHAILAGDDGVLTVVGGKLTTARRMAQDAVDRIAERPGVQARPCLTRTLPLVGATAGAPGSHAAAIAGPTAGELPPPLVRRYGAEAARVAALAQEDPALLAPLAPDVPVSRAELRFAIEHEGALTADDLLDRRTRLGLVPERRAAAAAAAHDALARV